MSTVRPATSDDLPAIGRVLSAAFLDDPVWNWLAPDSARFERRARPFFVAEAGAKLHGPGEVFVDRDLRGAAIWASPDRWRGTAGEALKLAPSSLRLFRRNLPRSLRTIALMEREHPREPPHRYLAVLGTHPDHQGKGVGSALLGAVLDRCDQEGLPAYLESSKERNVPFYARHGFEVTQEQALPGGPSIWMMWRDPR